MKTVFIRAIGARLDEKAAAIRASDRTPGPMRFDADPSLFSAIPKPPFAYRISEAAGPLRKPATASLRGRCGVA